jgi:hypothetical protein
MDVTIEKKRLAKILLATDNLNVIEAIHQIFKEELESDFWNNLSETQKNEIDEALIEIERGEVINYASFMEKHRSE